MDINGSNTKPQTGGLKLMTVFIAVLALHVVVIGGFTVYHLMSGGSDTDMTTVDKTHKGLNGASVADGTLPDPTLGDKSTAPTEVATIPATTVTPAPTTTTPTPDATATTAPATAAVATTSAPTPTTTPAPDATTASTTSPTTTAAAPASSPTPTATVSPGTATTVSSSATTSTEASAAAPAPVTEIPNPGPQTPSGPIPAGLAPPPDVAPASAPAPALIPVPQSAPASSLASGPVHMPPANLSPEAPRTEHEHMKVYIVKITDSYKKIAHKHHISVAQLKEANHIDNNVLHTGQKLYIPSEKGEIAKKSQLAEKASTSSLAATPIVSESAAPMTTGLTSTSTTLTTTVTHHHLYTVVKGDTLTKIAHRYKTTASAIMAENGITDPTKLSVGKKLRIPSSSEETRSARAMPVTPQPSQVQAKTSTTTAQLANYGN